MNDMTANATTKRFTLDEASAMLPLVRSIVSDICEVFRSVTSRRVELHRLLRKGHRGAGRIYDDEMAESRADLQAEYDRIWQFREELETLGILLRQPEEGLIEFPTQIDSQPAFYSWRLGEPTICHYRLASQPSGQRLPIQVTLN
ncbi:MAG: DUF2203 domain-containing protein [Pirellulales bacterium]